MDVSACLSSGVRVLKNSLEAEVLLAFLLDRPREFLLAHPGALVNEEKINAYHSLLTRREQGIPLAYLTHYKEFYGLDFYVDGRVLIPRPETELLVDVTIKMCKTHGMEEGKILDCGTGSGNIAIALAKHLQKSISFIACDISKDALKVARKNAEHHEVSDRIEFVESDLLENIKTPVDGIVANLPYIGTEKFSFVEKDVSEHEPDSALYGGFDGLRLYERLFRQIKHTKIFDKLKFLCVEFGFSQRKTLKSMLNNFFVQHSRRQDSNDKEIYISFYKDLAGIERVYTIVINI